jgi:hypothetical protein
MRVTGASAKSSTGQTLPDEALARRAAPGLSGARAQPLMAPNGSDALRRAGIDHADAVIFWQIFWQTGRGSEAEKRFGWWA